MVRSVPFFVCIMITLCEFNSFTHTYTKEKASFNKVIIWGHKLHSHTHSYIHYAFHKAFKHLGYETYWFDNADATQDFDFSNSLFITEGQVDQAMPLRHDCKYILHNCDMRKYADLFTHNRCIILQVYTHDVLARDVIKIADCQYYQPADKIVYMPWATDLLPHEIDAIQQELMRRKPKTKQIYWIGTTGGGFHGNDQQIAHFSKACREAGIPFAKNQGLEPEQNKNCVRDSYMAPALQGKWQCDVGYIPCRIFKNISYGQMGITNSKTVYDLFKGKIVYNPDTYQLFFDAKKKIEDMDLEDLFELMGFVKKHHTYINRIELLLEFLEQMTGA